MIHRKSCAGRTRKGLPCRAAVMKNSDRCVLHSDRAREIATLGGKASRVRCQNLRELPPPKTARAILDVLAQSTTEVRAGKMDARTGATIAALANASFRIVEGVLLESRLRAIEEKQREIERGGAQ